MCLNETHHSLVVRFTRTIFLGEIFHGEIVMEVGAIRIVKPLTRKAFSSSRLRNGS